METRTRILIADANPDFSSLMSDLVAGEKDMEVVGSADNGLDALSLIGELTPDVLLLDLVQMEKALRIDLWTAILTLYVTAIVQVGISWALKKYWEKRM